jgi:hypothetical protein
LAVALAVLSHLTQLHWWWRYLSRPEQRQRRALVSEAIAQEKTRLVEAGLSVADLTRLCQCLRRSNCHCGYSDRCIFGKMRDRYRKHY